MVENSSEADEKLATADNLRRENPRHRREPLTDPVTEIEDNPREVFLILISEAGPYLGGKEAAMAQQLGVKAILQYPEGLELGSSPEVRRFKVPKGGDSDGDVYRHLLDVLPTVFPDILGVHYSLFWKGQCAGKRKRLRLLML